MDYQQTLEYLYAQLPMFQRKGAVAFKKDLTNIIRLCDLLGNPQNDFPCIHIAGTNGKGSVAHMLSAVFQKHGYKTGLYTSPHYFDFRERIKINGQPISKDFVIAFTAQLRKDIKDIRPSFFELTVAMVFEAFKREEVDIAIIETGLGGRLDSTNIVNPLLSVITNIGFDHMEFLGDTLPLIAGEKAGIIKENTPCVIGEMLEETAPVFRSVAEQKSATLYEAKEQLQIENVNAGLFKSEMQIVFPDGEKQGLFSEQLPGNYQQYNIQTAIAATEIIAKHYPKWSLDRKKVLEAIAEVRSLSKLIGRFQKISNQPLFICDSAHNAHGLKEVMQQINKEASQFNQIHVIFGVVKEKNLEELLPLLPQHYNYYWCAAAIPRALPAEILQKQAQLKGLQGEKYVDVKSAVQAALKNANKNDLIFAGGSIFTVAEIPGLKED